MENAGEKEDFASDRARAGGAMAFPEIFGRVMADVETRFGATCPMRTCQGIIDLDQHGPLL